MPKFFFYFNDGTLATDADAAELPDAKTAWKQAIKAFGEMIGDLDSPIDCGPEWRMHATDETGRTLFQLRFSAERFT